MKKSNIEEIMQNHDENEKKPDKKVPIQSIYSTRKPLVSLSNKKLSSLKYHDFYPPSHRTLRQEHDNGN